MNETIRQVAYKLKVLAFDLGTLQKRTIATLFDILHDINLEAKPVPEHVIKNVIADLEGSKDIMKRVMEDIDVIIRKLKTMIEANKE
jgi:hypothetical protein